MVLESNTLDVLFVKDGQQGEDGKILYTWIKYAKDASGTGITDDPNGAIYIGISYNNESSIESNDPTQYAWTKIQGADGKKGEDAYTIFLENENVSFATDENRNPLSEQTYTSGITIMKGTKPVTDFTIGDIAKTQGIAVAKTDTAIAISIVNGNPLPNDSGEIEIPITVGDTVFKKILTWTCAKKGEQGDNAKNLSVTPSSQYFKSTDGGKTFAPNTITIKPTIQGEISFGKWQYSIDGGVSFVDVVSGQKGLTISNNVLTVSKDSSLYSDAVTMVTFRSVASDSSFYDTCSIAKIYDVSDIGDGRNLLWNSNFAKTDEAITNGGFNSWGLHYRGTDPVATIDTSVTHNGFNTLKVVSAADNDKNSGGDIEWYARGVSEKSNDLFTQTGNYTLSFYAKTSVATDFIVRWGYDAYGADTTRTLTTDWKRYEIKLHTVKTNYSVCIIFKLLTASTVWFSEFKLEKGSSATGYSPAPEDVQTAILSTKNSIDSVSSKVDTNTKSIQDKVSKTTYERELTLVKGDLSKANDGLNKWRYEIYPKSLFESADDQGKSTIDIFARNSNLVPSQTVLLDDASLSAGMDYGDNHIAYALTFVKMSAKKDVTTKMFNNDGASLYVNGGLVITRPSEYTNGEEITFTLAQGWNCIEVVVNEGGGDEGFRFSTTLSKLSECQMMNCYYGTPVARQSRITNQLVDVTKNLTGVTSTVQDVMTAVGNSGNITEFKNNYSKWKQGVDGIESRVGSTYVTNEKFDGLEIGGRNLLINSAFKNGTKDWTYWGTPPTRELINADGKTWMHIVGNQQKYQGVNQWTQNGSIKAGNRITFSARIKGGAGNQIFTIIIHWMNSSNTVIDQTRHTFTVGTTDGVYTWTTTASGANCSKLNLMVGVSDTSTAYNVYFTELKLEKGNKATDWTPAPEDGEINGQNLVSNLPANWEQGSFQDSKTNVGCDYNTNKSFMTSRIRVKELVPISGTITISNAYSNQSKKPIQHWITAFDVNKKWLGNSYVSTAWSDFPRTVDMKDAKYIAVIVRYKDDSAITPSDISQICLKIERGTSATPFTLAPEDVNGKIVNVETIANQTANKFEWIVKGGDKSSSMVLTDDFLNIVANNINLTGKVTFNSLSSDAKNEIGKVAQSKVDGLEIGGRNLLLNSKDTIYWDGKQTDSDGFVEGYHIGNGLWHEQHYKLSIKNDDTTKYTAPITISAYVKAPSTSLGGAYFCLDLRDSSNVRIADDNYSLLYFKNHEQINENTWTYVSFTTTSLSSDFSQNGQWNLQIKTNGGFATGSKFWYKKVKVEFGSKATDWTPAPEDYLPQASLVSNWTTNTTWIDGGKIYTGSITADKIAANSITADKIAANSITADKIATDAIKSRNYISSGGTQGSFLNLSDGSFTSPNLSWDSNGNLIATGGLIAGWTITNGKLYNGTSAGYAGIGKESVAWAFWAGASSPDDSANAPFRVGHNGSFKATNADITGTITAINGTIGKYEITDTYLKTGSGSTCSGFGSDYAFWAGNDEAKYAPFRVEYNGILNIEYIVVHGDQEDVYMRIGKDYLTIQDVNTSAHIGLDGFDFDFANSRIKTGDQGIELYGGTPYIDFHYDNSYADYTSRIIAHSWGFEICGDGNFGGVAVGGNVDCKEVHTSGAVIIASDSESFYWAHGYQIARGTSWGGVCIGDDSQGLRLYGTSIWASHSISTSDENLKENFTTLDQYEDFYMNLNPIGFNYIGDYDGKKTHFGFGAHKTEDILESEGYDSDKFAVVTHRPLVQEDIEKRFGKDVEVDIETEYGVSYTEFIALNTHMIQKTRRELTKVKQEKADLEARLQAIEAKLGL